MTKLSINSTLKLNNKTAIPLLGLGTYLAKTSPETEEAILYALQVGYRHIDTAAFYKNEDAVGRAIKKSNIPRNEIFVTTKLWNTDAGFDSTLKAFEKSRNLLDLDYVDLYLIHWPFETLRKESWQALEQLYKEGKCKSIGVSNYTVRHLKEVLSYAKVIPAVNQVEFSPFLYQKELLNFCVKHKIQLESYSPLTKGRKLQDPRLVALAQKYKKTPAQILIRWNLQHHVVVIPKSTNHERIKENADVFDFEISPADMNVLDGFNENYRTSWDPTNAP